MDANETNKMPSTNLSDSLPTDNTSGLSSLSTSSVSTSLSVSPVSIDSNNKQEQEQKSDTSDEQQQQKENENELILIQDNAFIVKISVPGLDLFDLQVTSMELVQEIHQMLMDKEETCHRTCFSLQLDGVTLDNFSELKTIEGLKEGSIIKLVDEPYTVREVRLHVRHVNDLIHSIDPIDNFNGVNCNSLSYINDITNGDICDKRNNKETNESQVPPDYILPQNKEVPIMPLHLNGIKTKQPACLKQLTFSGWNPPPGKRKMNGDLMYLHIITAEDKRFHLTASTRGFYVNHCTDDTFNPRQDNAYKIQHSLVDLLNVLSPTFKKNFLTTQKKRTQKHPFERIGTPFQVNSWLSPDFEHTVDWFRAEDSNASKLGHEDHIPGHSRDWNEEIQATKELPKRSLPERLIRERAMFKVHSDFVNAATRGAIAVVESNIMAINPGEDSNLGFDVKDHYKEFGGDVAAYTAPLNDLQGVKALNMLDIDGLHTLGTVVIDYKGYRVTAQSIIPGILDKDQEQSVVHGSTDFGKTCATNPKYNELLDKVCNSLKIRPHKIKLENEQELEMYSSIECKGIIGNDSRHYVLDLLRMFPPDLNYLPESQPESNEKFPRKFRHKLCCLRQELIDSFVDDKYIQFVRHAAKQIQENSKNQNAKDNEIEETKQLMKELTNNNLEENTTGKQIIENACKHINSLKPNEFDIRFNPNLFQPIVKLADNEEQINSDIKLLRQACDYLINEQIPVLIKDLSEHAVVITDGVTLCETLHSRGINIRYLGYFLEQIVQNDSLSYIYSIGINELVSRSCKKVFKQYIQSVPTLNLSAAIAHFLNCFLSNQSKTTSPSQNQTTVTASNTSNTAATTNATESLTNDNEHKNLSNKKRKKNQKKNNRTVLQENSNDWNNLTSRILWSQISEEAAAQYHFEIKLENNDEKSFSKLNLRKLTLLRSFCQKNGVQILLREYNFKQKTFHEDDILNMYPIVKHVSTKATDAYNFFTNGQSKIQQGFLKEGFELISEAYNLLTNVYGALHPEICMCLRLLSRLNYILGDYNEALCTQHKAVMMCERLYGVDHSQTITEYTHLSLYCFASGQINSSLKLLYRARYLLLVNYGEDHPEIGLIDSNLGLVLQAASEHEYALKFLENGLVLHKKYFGLKHHKTALSYHLLARLQSCRGDFRTALMNERETYQIYKSLYGEENERTKESAHVLKHLTEQAVLMQKKMNELHKVENNKFPSIYPPFQIQQPSLQTVLTMLNFVNGILFMHTQEEELDRIKDELLRLQQNGVIPSINNTNKSSMAATAAAAAGVTSETSISKNIVKINAQDDDLQ